MESNKKEVNVSREDIVSRIVVVGIFALLAVMMIGGLRTFILYPAGQVDQDIMPSVLGFYLFFLWITQFPLYLGSRKKLSFKNENPTKIEKHSGDSSEDEAKVEKSSGHGLKQEKRSLGSLLALFLFILCSFFLSAIILSYCNQIRLVTENGLPFSFPGFRDIYLFLLQMGNSLWYLDFPWGILAFPIIGTLTYLPFCLLWARKADPKRAARFTALSSGIFLLVSLLFSFSVQAIVVAQQGWPLPPQTRIATVQATGRALSSGEGEILSKYQNTLDEETLLPSDIHATYKYDRQKALDYAAAWFGAYNPAYYAYSQDCANFVSQCLLAGGMPMTSAWHSTFDGKAVFSGAASEDNALAKTDSAEKNSAENGSTASGSSSKDSADKDLISPAWRLAQKLFAYYADSRAGFKNGETLTVNSSTNMQELLTSAASEGKPIQPGDLLFFAPEGGGEDAINHAVLITGVSGDEIYFSSHNCSRLNEALSPHLAHKSIFIVRLNDVL